MTEQLPAISCNIIDSTFSRHKCPSRKLRDLRRLLSFNKQKAETMKLQNDNIRATYSQEVDKALSAQKDFYNKKHFEIMKNHSEKLKVRYEENFNKSLKHFDFETTGLKMQILKLSQELEVAKRAVLSSAIRRPVYSPGKYAASSDPDNG